MQILRNVTLIYLNAEGDENWSEVAKTIYPLIGVAPRLKDWSKFELADFLMRNAKSQQLLFHCSSTGDWLDDDYVQEMLENHADEIKQGILNEEGIPF